MNIALYVTWKNRTHFQELWGRKEKSSHMAWCNCILIWTVWKSYAGHSTHCRDSLDS